MLLPAATPAISDAQLGPIFPDGTYQFQPTNALTFTINSTLGVTAGNVLVQLLSTNLTSTTNTSQLLASGSGLTFSGTPTSLVVTAPLGSNLVYAAYIQFVDANGVIASTSLKFDTITPSYTWEAEDYDYGGGLYIDNPQTNAYAGLVATLGVDAYNPNGGSQAYRPRGSGADLGGDLGNEVNGDVPRLAYLNTGLQDYDVGWTGAGNWANYTRTYPAGVYNVYARVAINGAVANGANLAWVTSGLGTSNQTTSTIGRFNFTPATGGYQIYTWIPLVNSSGTMVTITNTGAVATLRMTELAGGFNLNFFLLSPVPVVPVRPIVSVSAAAAGNISVSWTPAGGTLFASPALSGPGVDWQPIGTANPALIPVTGAAQFFRVRVP